MASRLDQDAARGPSQLKHPSAKGIGMGSIRSCKMALLMVGHGPFSSHTC